VKPQQPGLGPPAGVQPAAGHADAPADGRGDILRMSGTVERGSFRLLADLSVAPGEVLGVLGPNGAGKTTLLRALAGLDALTSGSIHLGDLTMDDVAAATYLPTEHRPVGLVFQNYRLFPHLDVRDNVAYAPRVRGVNRARARAIADTWLERLDISALADRRPHQISGGQAQRVALARALAADPRLLLLDEPLAALDAKTRLDVRAQLRGHIKRFPGPVLIITHDPLEAMIMADRLLVIENGLVVQQGSPAAVARRPATQYVARLVGLNLYAGTLDPGTSGTRRVSLDDGGAFIVSLGDEEILVEQEQGESGLSGPSVPSGLAGGPVTIADPVSGRPRVLVGLRPSAITIHTAQPGNASPRNVWPGTVAGLEPLADRIRVQVDAVPPALVDISAAAVDDLSLRPGTPVWLSAKATETEAYADPRPTP
jgi:molybdate transport system ATP-binding protein